MKAPCIDLIQHLIFSLKAGNSVELALNTFINSQKLKWSSLHLSKKNRKKIPIDSVEYELEMILSRGLKGYPVLKSLEKLQTRSINKLHQLIDLHVKKAPFLALLPLFLFQVPSLALIFLFPLLDSFITELSI